MLQSTTLSIEVPNGYELTGEFRIPRAGELWLGDAGSVEERSGDTCNFAHPILRRKIGRASCRERV